MAGSAATMLRQPEPEVGIAQDSTLSPAETLGRLAGRAMKCGRTGLPMQAGRLAATRVEAHRTILVETVMASIRFLEIPRAAQLETVAAGNQVSRRTVPFAMTVHLRAWAAVPSRNWV
jgi:hypothetical protein